MMWQFACRRSLRTSRYNTSLNPENMNLYINFLCNFVTADLGTSPSHSSLCKHYGQVFSLHLAELSFHHHDFSSAGSLLNLLLWSVVLGVACYVTQRFHHLFAWYTLLQEHVNTRALSTHISLCRKYFIFDTDQKTTVFRGLSDVKTNYCSYNNNVATFNMIQQIIYMNYRSIWTAVPCCRPVFQTNFNLFYRNRQCSTFCHLFVDSLCTCFETTARVPLRWT
jgi:hypothetical protein